jgi:hypothetical protein
MVARHDVRGVELQVPQMFHGPQDGEGGRTRGAIQELRMDREAPRLSQRDSV